MGAIVDDLRRLALIIKSAGLSVPDVTDSTQRIQATVLDYLEERLNPPMAQIRPGSPFLADGDVFGAAEIRWEVDLVVAPGDNKTEVHDLLTLIDTLYVVLRDAGYGIDSVAEFSAMAANNTQYLSTVVTVVSTINP